jgi:ubiquinone/menaquinone biosynthesis C-methylase UbiE
MMSTPTEQPPNESSYIIDAESAAEMARLVSQDRLTTKSMGGLLPEQTDLSGIQRVLDVACGPGGWVLDMAFEHPDIQVVGIDISQTMIEYARVRSKVQKLENVSFQVMSALKPLDFPDASFDLVNARTIAGFMLPASWPALLQECMRITRPGGVIRLTETDDFGTSNSPALEKITKMAIRAGQLGGRTFNPEGRNGAVTAMLGHFLRQVGCKNIEKRAYVIDYSSGEEAHDGVYRDLVVAFQLLQPFLTNMGFISHQELEQLYQQVLTEMASHDFCAIWYLLTVWGQNPASLSSPSLLSRGRKRSGNREKDLLLETAGPVRPGSARPCPAPVWLKLGSRQ